MLLSLTLTLLAISTSIVHAENAVVGSFYDSANCGSNTAFGTFALPEYSCRLSTLYSPGYTSYSVNSTTVNFRYNCTDNTCTQCQENVSPLNTTCFSGSDQRNYTQTTSFGAAPATLNTANTYIIVYYLNPGCTAGDIDEVDVFTKSCFPSDLGDYNKYTCSASGLTIQYCSDSACNNCTAGTTEALDTCLNIDGYDLAYYCGGIKGYDSAVSPGESTSTGAITTGRGVATVTTGVARTVTTGAALVVIPSLISIFASFFML